MTRTRAERIAYHKAKIFYHRKCIANIYRPQDNANPYIAPITSSEQSILDKYPIDITKRKKDYIQAKRQIIKELLEIGRTYERIGFLLGMNHSSIGYHVKVLKNSK